METNNLGASNPLPGSTVTTTEVQQTQPVPAPGTTVTTEVQQTQPEPAPGTTVTTTEVQTQPVPTPVTMVTPVQIVPEPVVSSLQPTPVQLQPIPVMPVQQIPPMTSTTTTKVETEGKSNNKTIMILAVLIILIFLGVIGFILLNNNNAPVANNTVTPPPVSTPVAQPKTTQLIAYTASTTVDGIQDLNLLDTKTTLIENVATDVGSAKLSPDGKSILYISKPNGLTTDGSRASDVDVYDIATKATSTFLPMLGEVSDVNWSQDGKEIITDQGTSTIRTISIYDLATQAKLSSFTTSEYSSPSYSQYYWIDADNVVFMTNVMATPAKPVGTGGYAGISKINIRTGLVTSLLVPADTTEYTFVGTDIQNGEIAVAKVKYTGLTASSMGTSTFSYMSLNLTTGNATDLPDSTGGTDAYSVIKALLPSDLAGYSIEVPVKAVETNVYYVVVNKLVDNVLTNGRLYKVDTTTGVADAYTLVDTGTVFVNGVSVF